MPPLFSPLHAYPVGQCVAFFLAIVLTACGGGEDNSNRATLQSVARSAEGNDAADVESSSAAPSSSTIALQQEGARLNTAELEEIARTGVLSKAVDGPLFSGADTDASRSLGAVRKSAASRVPVYRFFNTRTSAHFFTTSEAERANVLTTLPFMTYEGVAFHASSTPVPGLSPVHRFYNRATGVHFYTISEAERTHIASTMPTFTYEGIAYHASTLRGPGYMPVHRFFYTARGFHFYTTSEAEKNAIVATLPQYSYEGVGYYLLDSDWQTPAVPHTGITSNQCYKAGTETVGDCSSPSVLALNPQQDGHRTSVNPMGYGAVGSHPLTSCAKDNVTGLIWEGKTASGARAGANTYTHHDDLRSGDASAYVNSINFVRLCGFNDWRLPTVEELHGLLRFGLTGAPTITAAWFPNTRAGPYWTNEPYLLDSDNVVSTVDFSTAEMLASARSSGQAVRLVRGTSWSTSKRSLVISVVYPGDHANNAVLDRKTGLVWRRCPQGLGWSGSACAGVGVTFTHEAALSHARSQSGWRLPNAKELATLRDLQIDFWKGDPGAFPFWSSDPRFWASSFGASGSSNAMLSNLELGIQLAAPRSLSMPVRLVMIY